MDWMKFISWLMLMLAGTWCGITVHIAIARAKIWLLMPIEEFAVDFRRTMLRVDPLQPILAVVSSLLSGVLAWHSFGLARILACAPIAVVFCIATTSIVMAEPVISKYRRVPEGTVPEGADQHRLFFKNFHQVRTFATIVAFALFTAAVIVR